MLTSSFICQTFWTFIITKIITRFVNKCTMIFRRIKCTPKTQIFFPAKCNTMFNRIRNECFFRSAIRGLPVTHSITKKSFMIISKFESTVFLGNKRAGNKQIRSVKIFTSQMLKSQKISIDLLLSSAFLKAI